MERFDKLFSRLLPVISPRSDTKVTITDIARVSGVSKSTVSLVLNNSPLVKPGTADKVRETAERLGYVYNRSAANLRHGSTNVIGLVVNDLRNSFFVELLIGAERKMLEANYITLLAHTAEEQSVQKQVLASMREQKAAGLILCPAFDTPTDLVDSLRQWGLPFVTVMRALGDVETDFVGCDNYAGMQMATQHLIDLGHTHIAFLGHKSGYAVSKERWQGYQDCMSRNGCPMNDEWMVDTAISVAGGQEAMTKLLDLEAPPTAAVCYNDLIAIGALNEIGRRGLRPGEDFAIVGSDGIASTAYCNPPLTTVALNPELLGEKASEMLLKRLRNPDVPFMKYLMKPRLIVRESCGATLGKVKQDL
ncbi:LacI family DNA-binding transcriptional regulator [Pseudomonas monteilii]|uniref:LacI family DNA-binding transcriptional regulator n=1 Tax=Pseudomonas monteilii TaxID=76759 RepID=UPI003D054858